ncbi:MAG: GIY-YIG nuclease family protein [Proteobacteria bacterium]|nr:GIY-YIG nuclease family protein [Pseudomonadota bacterium]NBX85841.1 GIY-YIG nuclease family protein [Pseudomonadota bacterium]
MNNRYWVYLLASAPRGYLYVGVTNNLPRRCYEHREKIIQGHTAKYNITQLVYYQEFTEITEAIRREKQLKRYSRQLKFQIVEEHNPSWKDLSKTLQAL